VYAPTVGFPSFYLVRPMLSSAPAAAINRNTGTLFGLLACGPKCRPAHEQRRTRVSYPRLPEKVASTVTAIARGKNAIGGARCLRRGDGWIMGSANRAPIAGRVQL
jgi:hypothetical protein